MSFCSCAGEGGGKIPALITGVFTTGVPGVVEVFIDNVGCGDCKMEVLAFAGIVWEDDVR